MLAGGSMLAVVATITQLIPLAIVAFALIGGGVGAAGTSLLALLATLVAPGRRAGAASLTWIMMIVGIVVTAGVAGALLDPFGPTRLLMVAGGVTASALTIATLAVWGIEGAPREAVAVSGSHASFAEALRELWADPKARRFTIFVFVSMLAYSMQDLILEPFAGLLFAYTPGQSTQLSGLQHLGVLVGMVLVGVGGSVFGGTGRNLATWTVAGCLGSAASLVALAQGAGQAPNWPLAVNVIALGFFNGMFAVAAIGAMMTLAREGSTERAGLRMGAWGAAQAIAFGLGGLTGALGVDLLRQGGDATNMAFATVFTGEAVLFLISAWLAGGTAARRNFQQEALA